MKKLSIITLFILLIISDICSAISTLNIKDLSGDKLIEKITELTERAAGEEQSSLVKGDLINTIEALKQYQKNIENYNKVKNAVDNEHEIIAKYRQQTKDIQKEFQNIQTKVASLQNLSLSELNKELVNLQSIRDETQKKLDENTKHSEMLFATTEFVQTKTLALQKQIEIDNDKLNGENLRQTEEDFYTVDMQVSKNAIEFYQFLNLSHSQLKEIMSTIVSYYKLKLDYDNEILKNCQQRIAEVKKQKDLQEKMRILEEINEVALNDKNISDSAQKLQEMNVSYRNLLNLSNNRINEYQDSLNHLSEIVNQVAKIESTVKSQIAAFKGSMYLSQILNRHMSEIPKFENNLDYDTLINNIRFDIYDNDNRLAELKDIARFKRHIRRESGETWTELQEEAVDLLIEKQQKLIKLLQDKMNEELTLLINIRLKNTQYSNYTNNITTLINNQMFWLQSNNPINYSWVKNFFSMAKREISGTKISFNASNFSREVLGNTTKILIVLLVSLVILINQKRINSSINNCNKLAARQKTDSHYNALKAIVLTFVKSMNWPCWSLIIGWMLTYVHFKIGVYDIGEIARLNNHRLAILLLMTVFSLSFFKENGINKIHFNCNYHKVLNFHNITFLSIMLCLTILCSSQLRYLETIGIDVIAKLTFIILLAVLEVLAIHCLCYVFKHKSKSPLRKIFAIMYTIIPASLIITAMSGYFYSSLRISLKLIDTYFFIFISILIYKIILKSVLLAQYRIRSMRRQREAMQKLAEIKAAKLHTDETLDTNQDDQLTIAIENDEMSIDDINKQTISILNICYITAIASLLFFMWSDFISVLSYLNKITLWTATGTDESGKLITVKSISVANVLISMYSLFMMFVLLKNLPGLLEVMVLNKFTTTRNASYSIKTILTYIIIAICLTISLSELGVSWENLQWLVAALSVGLGFGLQEIFGNFVSGLIILFERPIRLGDVVTIGDLSGTVTKIRIRATTILQFDNKELIVPNKTFITQSLTNWALTDSVTRLEINVGVGYNEDLEIVKNTLLDIADKCPSVMKTPAPKVYFFNFGDSNLDHVLYVYVKNISERNPTKHYLNTEIYNRFKELNIEIAYNQIDMYIKNTSTDQEIKISSEKNIIDGSTTA